MAIGVSYIGHDGRRQDFSTDGNPMPGSALDNLVRGNGNTTGNPLSPLADAMRRARRPMTPDPRIDKAAGTVKLTASDSHPAPLDEKLARGSSIVVAHDGLKLKGERPGVNNGFYAKKDGEQGFLSLDEIDNPNLKGAIIGEPDQQHRLDASNKMAGVNEAFGVNMQSRTEAEVNEDTGEVTFWEYTKRWDVTQGRRVGGVSEETKRKICSFFLGSERQITIGSRKKLFSVVRSHFTDEDGKIQYEFWVKNLKWGKERRIAAQYRDDEPIYRSDLENSQLMQNSILSYTDYYVCRLAYGGSYPFGEYGHYPRRPADRPRLLKFDDGRMAIADFFEERSGDIVIDDDCNCWTYVGSSVEGVFGGNHRDGNFSLYGYEYTYYMDQTYLSEQPRSFVTDEYLGTKQEREAFLCSRNSLIKDYLAHDTDSKYYNIGDSVCCHKIADIKDWEIDNLITYISTPLYISYPLDIVEENAKGEVADFKTSYFGKTYKDSKGKYKMLKHDVVVVSKE